MGNVSFSISHERQAGRVIDSNLCCEPFSDFKWIWRSCLLIPHGLFWNKANKQSGFSMNWHFTFLSLELSEELISQWWTHKVGFPWAKTLCVQQSFSQWCTHEVGFPWAKTLWVHQSFLNDAHMRWASLELRHCGYNNIFLTSG